MAFVVPKRHRMKHLDFDLLLVRDQAPLRRSVGTTSESVLAPSPWTSPWHISKTRTPSPKEAQEHANSSSLALYA
jgi:hypothetical protein